MQSISSHKNNLACHTLKQMAEACNLILEWNKEVNSTNDYLVSPNGVQKMAASCMLMESIGEGVKKLDRLIPNFLVDNAPNVPWNSVMGLRNHIAHGYFNLDAEIIYDVAINEIPLLRDVFLDLISILESDLGL
jgi:uncharacterized protein with HEPN domain